MTTPRTPITSRTRIFIAFIILPDSTDEDTILPIKSAPDIVALRARVETLEAEMTEQDVEALQISLGAAQMDIIDLLESRRADRLEMAELRSRAEDIKAILWEIERHLGP
ncbi:hypothetical protein Tco_0840669 [Tanacetum coccineum]|uniref:Uncharacterized protein n=1 Tax=Tanacetum coccineum TaxID=301880 RepID=A0ABQ5AXR3_9ASTR